MANSVTYSCSALVGVNKAGTLKADENGYREVVLGALNVFNSAGERYVFEEAKHLFDSSGMLQRRVEKGVLRGEYGHPKPEPGMTEDGFARRVMEIREPNICCHYKSITLDFGRVKDDNGKPVIAIIGWVCPSGPNGPALERSLNNKDENVCFSIRAFTDDYKRNGIRERVLRSIVTWDYVNEPGIAVAQKFKAPALENENMGIWLPEHEQSRVLGRGVIERAASPTGVGLAMESIRLSADDICRSMGWASNPGLPAWTEWK